MELDKNKTKYFVIAIILLIILGVILIVHFNNKSMVSGDKEDTTKKTTEKVTKDETTKVTTKKVEVNEISVNKDIYKSVIDDENKLLYNYKLTDEISDTDIIISKVLDLNEEYKNNNIIGLFDISLYDSNMIKKSVNNSLITISIPITGALIGYDDYKIVYIDNNSNITDEEFNTTINKDYITFDTTHLSIYGVIGIKNSEEPVNEEENNEVDLDDVNVKIAFNNELVNNNDTIYTTTNDTVDITVSGVDNYKVYYGLQDKDNNMEYKEITSNKLFSDVTTYSELKLFIKVVIGSQEKTFELNTFKVYDIVYVNNNTSVDTVIGEVELAKDEESYDYSDEERNKDIAIVEDNEMDISDKVAVSVMGNIYLVEEVDISKLEMTGYLTIDTEEEIHAEDNINITNLHKVYINSEIFNYNGTKYTYRKDDKGNIIINKYVEQINEEEKVEEVLDTKTDVTDEFKEIFKNENKDEVITIDIDEETNGLVISKEESELDPE